MKIQYENDDKGKAGFRDGLGYYLGKYESTELKIESITEGKIIVTVQVTSVIKLIPDGKVMTNAFNIYISLNLK